MKRYFQEELDNIWKTAGEFSRTHPSLAPLIGDASGDPEVNRLFQGVAWMISLLREKLDDAFPEIVHELARLCWPHYIRPLPATAIIKFVPREGLRKPATIPAGVYIDSEPVDGAVCRFQTRRQVELQPLSLEDASWSRGDGQAPNIALRFRLNGLKLSVWKPDSIRLFLAGRYRDASTLYFCLRNHLDEILVRELPDGSFRAPPSAKVNAPALSPEFSLLPYPSNAFPEHRLIQEYFWAPEKFLFADIDGLDSWRPRGEGSEFELVFRLRSAAPASLTVDKNSFELFATPAVNMFKHPGAPVIVDHKKTEYPVRPEGESLSHYQTISVNKVAGIRDGGFKARVFDAFHNFNPKDRSRPVYNEILRRNLAGDKLELSVAVSYPDETPESETLSLELTCSNGRLPERLAAGDVRFPTDSSPEFATFANLAPPTPGALPDIGSDLLWKLIAYLGMSVAPLSRDDNFKTLLRLHVPENGSKSACLKRIDGISSLTATHVKRAIGGVMMSGSRIDLKANHEYFAGKGDLFVFGEILNVFLGMSTPFNSFAALVLENSTTGDIYKWQEINGAYPLI